VLGYDGCGFLQIVNDRRHTESGREHV
jgi:hypothetical protein